jgi:hypothetical protein
MADSLINVLFDPASLATITHLGEFGKFLDPEIAQAMQQIGSLLEATAVANTWTAFANPTGELANSIAAIVKGPLEVDLSVGVPYAWRMEEGFKGTDSLGRVYDEEGKPYAMPALLSNEANILQIIGAAAAEAFVLMGR